ncbi:MAG: DUF2911 domain-containing protein [Gemmatimonadales bacterium]
MRILLGTLTLAIAAGISLVDRAEAQASPRDTTRAVVAGANVLVDYGRPSKRGREIFGGLVPYGRVWRTGANEATHLVTDKPLMFGSTMVPAGTYTLYTLPAADGWQLIINKQTGQWGTSYDESQDHARVPMRVASLPEVVEQFTIKIEPGSGGGVLKLEWDRTVASIPFMVH